MQKSDWERALESARLSTRQKEQHRLIIRWFLGYCQKRQPPAPPGRDLANAFDRELRRNRKPPAWQLDQWRAGLRWLLEFLAEKPAVPEAQPTAPPADKGAWRQTMIGQARLKHLSYRTEQTYVEWVSRFAGFLNGRNPLTATDADAVGFLSDLAVRKQVAGATQNQAFNALQADHAARVKAFVRLALVGRRHGYPHGAVVAGAPEPGDDADLSARDEKAGIGGEKPAGLIGRVG